MNIEDMQQLVLHQLKNFFPLEKRDEILLSEEIIRKVVSDTSRCLKGMGSKYYKISDAEMELNLYNSVINCIFLYWLSRDLFLKEKIELADKVYYLNKALNSVELFYEVKLPPVWSCEHPLGSVMGRAYYGNYFFFYQGCTVGGNFKKDGSITYPVIGDCVKMFSNSKILGNSRIGSHTIISANCYIKDQDVPDNTIVYGQSPNLIFKENRDHKNLCCYESEEQA